MQLSNLGKLSRLNIKTRSAEILGMFSKMNTQEGEVKMHTNSRIDKGREKEEETKFQR